VTAADYYHLSKQAIARGQGRSAVAAVAYRTAARIENAREGGVADYSRKRGVVASWTVAPEGAPDWARDTARLWNAVEAKETRKNSQLAHEITLALPSCLDDGGRRAIMERFAEGLCERYGCGVTVAIHRPSAGGDDRNEHAHVMLTTRGIGAEGWGEKIRALNSLPQVSQEVAYIREFAAGVINDALEEAGEDERVDHRSFKARGITDRAPTTHLGVAATAIERAGRGSDRGDINRDIIEERLRWQMEQAQPELTADIAQDLAARFGDLPPLGMGAETELAPLVQVVAADVPPFAPGTEPDSSEAYFGWRRVADRISAMAAKAAELLRDETSGGQGSIDGGLGPWARLARATARVFSDWTHRDGRGAAHDIEAAAKDAQDILAAMGNDGEGHQETQAMVALLHQEAEGGGGGDRPRPGGDAEPPGPDAQPQDGQDAALTAFEVAARAWLAQEGDGADMEDDPAPHGGATNDEPEPEHPGPGDWDIEP
jgi:hypothetical protein